MHGGHGGGGRSCLICVVIRPEFDLWFLGDSAKLRSLSPKDRLSKGVCRY